MAAGCLFQAAGVSQPSYNSLDVHGADNLNAMFAGKASGLRMYVCSQVRLAVSKKIRKGGTNGETEQHRTILGKTV